MFKPFTNKIPAYYLVLAMFIGCGAMYLLLRHPENTSSAQSSFSDTHEDESAADCSYKIARLQGYNYIKPLVFAEQSCESKRYAALKSKLTTLVAQYQSQGELTDASVYVRDFRQAEWISYNGDAVFHPASLIKIVALITCLRMEEKQPGFLDTRYTFEPPKGLPSQTYISHSVQPGKAYSVRELLHYMIAYSDNNATFIVNSHLDVPAFRRTFTDLGLPNPNVSDMNFQMTAKDYAIFLKALYNGAYLNIANSEFATELLSHCTFKDGIEAGLPKGTKLVHKFGEWGDGGAIHELHDAGIIYLDNLPYMVVIMTRGNNVAKLPEVIKNITQTIHQEMQQKAGGGAING